MATIDLRATQKSYKPKTDHNRMDSIETRMKATEQSLNLILKKLEENAKENGTDAEEDSKEKRIQ